MSEYIEERRTTDDKPFLNPLAIIIVLLLLAGLAYYLFAYNRPTNNTTNNNFQPTENVVTPTNTGTGTASPSGTR